MQLDKKDTAILALLKQNARITVAEIARNVHLARTTVQERITRLQTKGVIKGYTTILDNIFDDINTLTTLVTISVDTKKFDSIISQLHRIPEIKRCAAISGSADIFIEINVPNVNKLEQLLALLGAIEGINQTQSNIVLNSYF